MGELLKSRGGEPRRSQPLSFTNSNSNRSYKTLEENAENDCKEILAVKAAELQKKNAVEEATRVEVQEIKILQRQKRKDELKLKKTKQVVVAQRVIAKASAVLNKKKKEKTQLLAEAEKRKKPVKKSRVRITVSPSNLKDLEKLLTEYDNHELHKLAPFIKICFQHFQWSKTKCFKIFNELERTTSFKIDNKKKYFTI